MTDEEFLQRYRELETERLAHQAAATKLEMRLIDLRLEHGEDLGLKEGSPVNFIVGDGKEAHMEVGVVTKVIAVARDYLEHVRYEIHIDAGRYRWTRSTTFDAWASGVGPDVFKWKPA